MPKKYSFKYRRRNPDQFPYVCDTCVPQRRFLLPLDQKRHELSSRHQNGILKAATPHFFEYSSPRLFPKFGLPASSSSLSSVTESNLNIFVLNEIEPDTAYNQSCRAVVDRLCQFMQNNFPDKLRPSEVRKSGSLGKGTAVKGKSDADLVVFLASYDTISEVRGSMNDILGRMLCYLGHYGECNVEETTSHAVKVSVTCHGHSHDVDILPSVDILKKESTGYQRLPSSYPLELIVIGQWENAGKPQMFNLRKGFYHVMRAIANYKSLRHAWTVNYNSNFVSSDEYYVADPANPFNNVMKACNCWETVAEKARAFLQTPLFQRCSIVDGWV